MAKRHWQRPSSRLTLAFLIGLVLLVGLGTWQARRLLQKNQQSALIADRLTLNPIALPAANDLKDLDAQAGLDFRRVRLHGEFLHEAERHWWRPSSDGRAGYHVLTPLYREGGEVVWINRGWVPPELKEPSTRPLSQVKGLQNIEGIARLPVRRGVFTPSNDPAKNLWYTDDPEALKAGMSTTVVPVFFPLVVEAVSASPGGYPLPGQTQIILRNPHLGYAITWYGLAVALIGVFAAYHWRKDPS